MRGRASRPDLHGGAVILIGWRATATMVAPESPPIAATPPSGSAQAAVLDRESGLRRNLTPRQLSMIALGGAIGTGLSLGSEVVAAAIYCRFWFPGVPAWVWIAAFSAALVYVNARSVASFGWFEYWFALIKVVTIVLFLILGAALLLGIGFKSLGAANYTAHGGFLPHGWLGVGLGIAMAIFSYLGIEIIAVTAGEAEHPETTVPRALRRTLLRLAMFYIGGVAVLVGVM